MQGENESLKAKIMNAEAKDLFENVETVNGVTYITYETKNQDMNALRQLADQWRQKVVSDLFVVASATDGKVNMLAAVSKDKLEQGLKAGDLIKTLAPFAGGKGGASRKTPDQIRSLADAAAVSFDAESLVKASRLSAKVDNTALQDGYQLYHHVFCFTRSGAWGVVQQGMNDATSYARRYHWFSPRMPSFVNEPHSGIASQSQEKSALNMVAADSEASRLAVTQVVREGPRPLSAELAGAESLALPGHHWISAEDLSPRGFQKTLLQAYEPQPSGFEDLLLVKGMGPKALRALVLVAELVHGAKPSWRDPAVYSFAHGGKDGIPHPVDRPLYDATVATLKHAIESSKLGNADKLAAIRRLASFWPDV